MKRNLLIITQTVDKNDSNLGFFCGWLNEFAKQLDFVYVIANKVGSFDLPSNVIVMSLGKEDEKSRLVRMINFWKYLLKYLPKVDSLFVHMCSEYVVYGGWIARLYGKKIGLWYLHKSLTWKLVLANILVNSIFTAHSDGYPIKSKKVIVTGHGIDLNLFKKQNSHQNDKFTMLTIGRISESKNLLILAKSVIILQQKMNKPIKFVIVGEAYLEKDKKYLEELKKYIKEEKIEDFVEFVGKVSHEHIANYYEKANVFLNAGKTGGVDKAVLEAMASGLPVITSNFTFKNILPPECLFEDGDLNSLVEKILNYKNINTESLYNVVAKNHSLENTVNKIISSL